MNKRNPLIRLLCILLPAVCLLCACGAPSPEQKLHSTITVTTQKTAPADTGSTVVTATVTLPDYPYYLDQVMPEAEAASDTAEAFQNRLYQLLFEAVQENPKTITRTVTVDLTALNPEKSADRWSENELTALVQQAAFDQVIREYAASLLLQTDVGGEAP